MKDKKKKCDVINGVSNILVRKKKKKEVVWVHFTCHRLLQPVSTIKRERIRPAQRHHHVNISERKETFRLMVSPFRLLGRDAVYRVQQQQQHSVSATQRKKECTRYIKDCGNLASSSMSCIEAYSDALHYIQHRTPWTIIKIIIIIRVSRGRKIVRQQQGWRRKREREHCSIQPHYHIY